MIASYIKIEGGTNYKLEIPKENLKIQNPEFRLICNTASGQVNIELPIIDEAFESNYNAKIFIDDADNMADVNNIIVTVASKISPIQRRVNSIDSVREIRENVDSLPIPKIAITIMGDVAEKLASYIGNAMILSGFGDQSKNNGSHIIDDVKLFINEKKDTVTRIFSSSLLYEAIITDTPIVTINEISFPSSIEGSTQYVVSSKGDKLEIFISNNREYGVLKRNTLVGSSKRFAGLINGDSFTGLELNVLRNDIGGVSISKLGIGLYYMIANRAGSFLDNKTIHSRNDRISYLVGKIPTVAIIAFTYMDSSTIQMEILDSNTGARIDAHFQRIPFKVEVFENTQNEIIGSLTSLNYSSIKVPKAGAI